jgi:hypothetical protein
MYFNRFREFWSRQEDWVGYVQRNVRESHPVIIFVVVTETPRTLDLTTPDQKFSAANATLGKNKTSGRLEW